jgi:hypothetical protein
MQSNKEKLFSAYLCVYSVSLFGLKESNHRVALGNFSGSQSAFLYGLKKKINNV